MSGVTLGIKAIEVLATSTGKNTFLSMDMLKMNTWQGHYKKNPVCEMVMI